MTIIERQALDETLARALARVLVADFSSRDSVSAAGSATVHASTAGTAMCPGSAPRRRGTSRAHGLQGAA